MTIEKRKLNNLMSRREFIGSVMLATTSAALITSCKSSNYQIGCYTRPWPRGDYRVAFDGMAEAGYKFAGLMSYITPETTPEEAAKMGEEAGLRGLRVASIYSGFDVRQSVAEGIGQLKRVIDNAASCGSPSVLLGGTSNPELVDAYYKVIAECCDYGADKGVGLAIKPHGGTTSTGAECRQHIERVGHKNFRLWYDPGNILHYSDGKIDPVEDVADVHGIVAGVCVKDFRMPRGNPGVNITPGTGMVDFPELFTRLRQGGFTRGPMIVETLNRIDDVASLNAEAKKARLWLEELTS